MPNVNCNWIPIAFSTLGHHLLYVSLKLVRINPFHYLNCMLKLVTRAFKYGTRCSSIVWLCMPKAIVIGALATCKLQMQQISGNWVLFQQLCHGHGIIPLVGKLVKLNYAHSFDQCPIIYLAIPWIPMSNCNNYKTFQQTHEPRTHFAALILILVAIFDNEKIICKLVLQCAKGQIYTL